MAAGSTYTPLATTTLGSNQASYTFSSIAGTYTDLILVISGKHSANSNEGFGLQFNSDTGSNYSSTILRANAGTAYSTRASNQTRLIAGWLNVTDIGVYINHIQNYSNTTTYKTVISNGAQINTNTYNSISASLWRSTSAITSITVIPDAASLATGMTLTLYGIAAA